MWGGEGNSEKSKKKFLTLFWNDPLVQSINLFDRSELVKGCVIKHILSRKNENKEVKERNLDIEAKPKQKNISFFAIKVTLVKMLCNS